MNDTAESAGVPRTRVYVVVWLGLLLIVATEVTLTYAHLSPGKLLACPARPGVAGGGAGGDVLHASQVRAQILFWSLIPGLIFVLLMLNQLWFDAIRLRTLHP
jgi:hypothetical protein